MLFEPELEDAVNFEAALMLQKSPKLYEQLARDSVVASRRLERGVSMFDDSLLDSTDDQSIRDISEQGYTAPIIPKSIDLSFEQYYQDWCE